MAIVKTPQVETFNRLYRGAPFAVNMTLYSRSDNKEEPKEYILFKLNNHKAVTVDKRTTVHFTGEEMVSVCVLEKKEKKPAF
jgi:hypothetical protein